MRRAGRNIDNEKLADAFESLQGLDIGSGSQLGFSPSDHQASHKVWAVEIDATGQLQDVDL